MTIARGRPPATRIRVLTYIRRAKPDTVAQIARVLQIDRANVYRILRAIYGPNFRQRWRDSDDVGDDGAGLPLAA